MPSPLKKTLFGCAALTLAAAVAFQVYSRVAYPPTSRLDRALGEMLPAEAPGWVVADEPVAASETLRDWTEQVLQYDDAAIKTYTAGSLQVSVYAAYWKPGKKPYAMVGAHNPDSCWVNAGWERVDRANAIRPEVGGRPVKPCEYGKFTKAGQSIEVVFWHLVGGETNSYDQQVGWRNGLAGRIERLPLYWKDFRTYGFDQHRDQLFVRISTNAPFDRLWDDPRFAELMNRLGPFGLFADGGGTAVAGGGGAGAADRP